MTDVTNETKPCEGDEHFKQTLIDLQKSFRPLGISLDKTVDSTPVQALPAVLEFIHRYGANSVIYNAGLSLQSDRCTKINDLPCGQPLLVRLCSNWIEVASAHAD